MDFTNEGKEKAEARAKERLRQLDNMEGVMADLRKEFMDLVQKASEKHDKRAGEKACMAAEVEELLEEKINHVEAHMVVDEEESEGEFADALELTEEEKRNEDLTLQLHRLQKQNNHLLGNFREAA